MNPEKSKPTNQGDSRTKEFYDKVGWQLTDKKTNDSILFHPKEIGPIHGALLLLREKRIKQSLNPSQKKLRLLECGCGGNPAQFLFSICSDYTGADFSEQGIAVAREKIKDNSTPHQLVCADICQLPFKDASFDAVYSAHAVYHIPNPASQLAAYQEMLRVLKPGGRAVVISINPKPWLFADASLRSRLLGRTRKPLPVKKGPEAELPYGPVPLEVLRDSLAGHCDYDLISSGVGTNYFMKTTVEADLRGRAKWRLQALLEKYLPRVSARLGSFIQVTLTKR